MKKTLRMAVALLFVLLLVLTFGVAVVSADPGGLPGAHGVDGPTFGGVVADAAQTDPAGLVAHVLECTG